jgi:hypothetical protein
MFEVWISSGVNARAVFYFRELCRPVLMFSSSAKPLKIYLRFVALHDRLHRGSEEQPRHWTMAVLKPKKRMSYPMAESNEESHHHALKI